MPNTQLKNIKNPLVVFVKIPKTEARNLANDEWQILERFLLNNQPLTASPPMLFDNVWAFDERQEKHLYDGLLGFLKHRRLDWRVYRMHGDHMEIVDSN